MRNSRLLSWGIIYLAVGLVGCAGQGTDQSGAAEVSPAVDLVAEEAAVRGVIDDFYAAAKQKDWGKVSEVMSDDFRLFADGAEVYEKAPYLEILEQEDLGVLEMALNNLEIHVASDGKTAWSTFNGHFKHSEELEVETAETLVFEKRAGEWKMVHAHAAVKMLGAEGPAEETTG